MTEDPPAPPPRPLPAPERLTFPSPRPEPPREPGGGGWCAADLHLPAGNGPFPTLIMAHGIGAERAFGLAAFARRFASRGLAVLVFDYRHHGESPGDPRRLVSPRRQREDYRAALAFLRSHPRLDETRVGLWGTSFSGGHVLALGAERLPGVRCLVSQIPFVSGVASTLAFPFRLQLPATLLGIRDALRGLRGRPPLEVPVVREDGGLALLASPDAHPGYRAMIPPESDWPNQLPARVFLEVLRYHPGRRARRIELPTLFVVALDDAICPPGATLRVARRIGAAQVMALPAGHFDPYRGEAFEAVVAREEAFLVEHLLPDAPAAPPPHPLP